uniref:DUF2207 domain-containing protein n=1 Tax=Batrachochytrium dendrobatidis (strain JAM81 / FGSC 10211) TaxID=684364 RepID=F4PEW3_BATDJ|eukprot:XP_006683149.1 hypothetical protein BATDEDRAFT_28708 [Batrachochytrium dendrobatidis JAM81]
MFPLHALAVDFTINETKIDAHLGEDGNVQVKETHTYEFDGKFNGITRSILPKDKTSIIDFKAAENGTPLEVELEDETYKIFRGGNDETVTIELSYMIHHGVEVKRQTTKLESERLYTGNSIVPEEIMTMPATIYYFRSYMAGFSEMLTTGMMDLVRKGNIEARENETYHLVDSKTDFKHEAQLIHLLFKKIGKNGLFSFELLENHLKVTVNQMTFNNDLNMYRKAIIEEIDSHHLFDKQVKLRLGTGIISLLLIPLMIIFGIHQLFMWLFICLILLGGLLLFSFLFKPRTGKGLLIKHQWEQFKKNFTGMKSNSWYTLSKADKERALIFLTGLKDQKLTEKSKTFAEMDAAVGGDTSYNLLLLLSLFTIANINFGSATEISAQSSDTTSYTGTGVGGGGGGSGAF